ncbi:MAG: hypothetical protein ACRD82_04495, partial [Blastocatellia bacterium]
MRRHWSSRLSPKNAPVCWLPAEKRSPVSRANPVFPFRVLPFFTSIKNTNNVCSMANRLDQRFSFVKKNVILKIYVYRSFNESLC